MADTIRSKTDFLALVADNTTRDISAQDLRDCLVSIHGVYGSIITDTAGAAQTLVAATPEILEFAANGGVAAGVTETAASNYIVVGTAGVYMCHANLSISSDTANVVHQFHIAKNGTDVGSGAVVETLIAGDQGTASLVALVSCAANDQISVNVEADKNSDVTLEEGDLIVHRIA